MLRRNPHPPYPLPTDYDNQKSPYYVPAKYRANYQAADVCPEQPSLSELIKEARDIIETEAEAQARKAPEGPPRENAHASIVAHLEAKLDDYYVPLARHNLRLFRVARFTQGEELERENAQLVAITQTCALCGELQDRPLQTTLTLAPLTGANIPNGYVCLKCEAVAKMLYASLAGSDKIGSASRLERVQRALGLTS
jgi:hypothetical protein